MRFPHAVADHRHPVLVLDRETVLYRACFTEQDGVADDSLRSHYEQRKPPRGPESRAAVIHMAVSMFDRPDPCWSLIERTHEKIGDRVAELRLSPGRGICIAKTAGPGRWSIWGRVECSGSLSINAHEAIDMLDRLKSVQTIYSIFDETGNLVDAFDNRDAAVAALTAMVNAEPAAADDLFLVGQSEDGAFIGETLYGSTLVAA